MLPRSSCLYRAVDALNLELCSSCNCFIMQALAPPLTNAVVVETVVGILQRSRAIYEGYVVGLGTL